MVKWYNAGLQSRQSKLRECSLMVKCRSPKPETWVRFLPLPIGGTILSAPVRFVFLKNSFFDHKFRKCYSSLKLKKLFKFLKKMRNKKSPFLFLLALVTAGVLIFAGCEIPFIHQMSAANQKVTEVKDVFTKADAVFKAVDDLSHKVYADSITNQVMSNNLEEIKKKEEELKKVKEDLTKAEEKLKEISVLSLPGNYKSQYLPALGEARRKRLDQLKNADDLLYKSKNLATSIVSYYSAISRLQQISDKMAKTPKIQFENPETIKQAQAIFKDVSSETKVCQTEFNEAAAAVNVDVFTKLRDSASDLSNMAEAADVVIKTLDALLKAAQSGNQPAFVEAYNLLPAQLEVMLAALDKFAKGFPQDMIDQNNDLTTKAQNQIQVWKDENFKDLFNAYSKLEGEIKTADQKVTDLYKKW